MLTVEGFWSAIVPQTTAEIVLSCLEVATTFPIGLNILAQLPKLGARYSHIRCLYRLYTRKVIAAVPSSNLAIAFARIAV